MGLDTLLEILARTQERYPKLAARLREAEALSRWEKAVGAQIAKHARALRVQEECLWVEVDHPLWKTELHHRKLQILEVLNRQEDSDGAGDEKPEILKDIIFVDPRGLRKGRRKPK